MSKLADLLYRQVWSKGILYSSALLLNIVLANILHADNTGILFFFTGNFFFLILLFSLNVDAGITYCYARRETDKQCMQSFIPAWSLIITILLTILYYFSRTMINPGGGSYIPLQSVFLFSAGTLLFSYSSAMLAADKKFVPQNIVAAGVNILLIIGLLIGLIPSDTATVFHYFFFSYFFQGVILFIYFLFNNSQSLAFKFPAWPVLKKIFSYSIMALAANIVFGIFLRIDYWMIQWYHLPVNELGNYLQVQKLIQQVLIIPGLLALTLFPLSVTTSKENSTELLDKLSLVTRVMNFFLLPCLLLIGILGKWLFPFVFGKSFDEMYRIFYVLAPSVIILSTCTVLATYLAGRNKIRSNLLSAIIAIIITWVLCRWLIPLYGTTGAGIAASLGSMVYFLVLAYFFTKNTGYNAWLFIAISFKDISKLAAIFRNRIKHSSSRR